MSINTFLSIVVLVQILGFSLYIIYLLCEIIRGKPKLAPIKYGNSYQRQGEIK